MTSVNCLIPPSQSDRTTEHLSFLPQVRRAERQGTRGESQDREGEEQKRKKRKKTRKGSKQSVLNHKDKVQMRQVDNLKPK